ncbi:serine dehydratase [Caulobacter sp. Root1455]|uniref:L-serine ammonia-lyase n=1 Tax=unclassified Caulobacter TaxID=2648921 RepID=UPI0006FF88C1|nr:MULTISPECIES: L-serine ammonia-lyase [unclassified Caulobacter]KQY35898.1 serine dehydratase [Caulobacter sp. Root487D2Y]KQZ06126.1 serine dehydratase [Caulobacter sp. Root1455]
MDRMAEGAIVPELDMREPPAGSDRRAFMMRSAMALSIGALTGCKPKDVSNIPAQSPGAKGGAQAQLDPNLNVVKKSKGPVMTTAEEFYKVGPGPSSSHTIGPMRITYDFYKRAIKLPAEQLATATALKVNLFGSLSATGKGHGTERASLAGLIGMEPATVDPAFLDGLAANPNQTFPVTLGAKTINVSLKDVIYDATKGDFHHPNTMTCKLLAGDKVLLEQEYYSVGGGFIEWKGYTPPKKNPPKYPYARISEALAHCKRDNISLAQLAMANEVAITGNSEAEVNAFLDKILGAMDATVKTGLAAPTSTLPGPIKLKTKAHDVYVSAQGQEGTARRAIALVSAYALAGSEENARGHLVITAPTGGSAGVLPAVIYSLGPAGAKMSKDKLREALLAGLVIGYLCKHNATLAAAEGGCQAEIGVASAMGAAAIAQAYGDPPQVAANAAEGALEHHLGMTCDPLAGFVQVPCIERCAFGAVKAWTGYLIATNEVPVNRRVDFDSTVDAMALTAKEMNPKYKETSEGGLAVSVTLC